MRCKLFLSITVILIFTLFANIGYAAIDFGGRTVTFSYHQDLEGRHFGDARDRAHLEAIEEKFNVKIAFHNPGLNLVLPPRLTEWLAPQMLSGQVEADVVLCSTLGIAHAANAGFMAVLDEYLNDEYWKKLPPIANRDVHLNIADGSYYSFRTPGDYSYNPLHNHVIIYNSSLLEEQGLPCPYELYVEGDWTWDAFREIATAATRDTTGDGEINQYGFAPFDIQRHRFVMFTLHAWLGANNASPIRRDADGRVVYTLNEPAAIETLEFLQQIYHIDRSGYANPEPMGGGAPQFAQFENRNIAMLQADTLRINRFAGMADDLRYVPIPKGPNADYHRPVVPFKLAFGIPLLVEEDPAALIELTQALFKISEEYRVEDDWEAEIERWSAPVKMQMRDIETYEVYLWNHANWEPIFGMSSAWIPSFDDVIYNIVNNNHSVTAEVESIATATQAYLDEVYNNK